MHICVSIVALEKQYYIFWVCLCSLMACTCSIYWHRRPVWMYHILPHYLVNGRVYKKKVTEYKILMKSDFENYLKIRWGIQVSLNLTRITSTKHEDQCTFLIISCSLLLRRRHVSVKVVEKFKGRDLCSVPFLFLNVPFMR
jgi:hypothetical protein